MKRIWFFIISAMLAFCTAGSRDTVSSLDRAMVHAVGIDADGENYKLTLQIFRPDSAGTDTQLDPAKANIFVITASAPTVGQALAECENRLGEFLFIGHNQLVVIGEDVSLENSRRLLAAFIRSKESYLGAEIACAENAEKLLSAELSEGAVAAQSIVGIIERHAENSDTVKCDLLTAAGAEDGTVVMPRLKVIKTGGEKTVSAAEAEVYVYGKRSFTLNKEECCGLTRLRRKCSETTLSVETAEGLLAVDADDCSCRRELTFDGSRLKLSLAVSAEIQNDQSIEVLTDREETARRCSRELTRRCGRAAALCRERQADLIGLSQLVRSRYPQLWLDLEGSFERILEITDIEVSAEVTVKG